MASVPLQALLAQLQGQTAPKMDRFQSMMSAVQAPPGLPDVIEGQRRHPGEFLPGEAGTGDVQTGLANILLSAGVESLPGIGPHSVEARPPGSKWGRGKTIQELTREEFMGHPTITPKRNASELKPRLGLSAFMAPSEPFINGLTIKRGIRGYVVMDGDTPVASYNGSELVVSPKYRRQGIATELVYDFRTKNPNVVPASARTKTSQHIQELVWQRIQSEKNK